MILTMLAHRLCTIKTVGVESNYIFGGPNVIYTVIAAICTACMNIDKVARVKYCGGLAYETL